MSLVNPIYVTFKFDKQELEGELIPIYLFSYTAKEREDGVIWGDNYFDVNEPKENKEDIYCRYKNIQGYIRPFDAEKRKFIFKAKNKARPRKFRFEKSMSREDIESCDAFNTSNTFVSDVRFIHQKDIKTTKEEIELCRAEIVERNSRWLKSMCNNTRNLIAAYNKNLDDLKMGKTDTITKIYNNILCLAFPIGIYYGFMESTSLGILWCIVGYFIFATYYALEPVKKKEMEDSINRLIENVLSVELSEYEKELAEFTAYLEKYEKHSCSHVPTRNTD